MKVKLKTTKMDINIQTNFRGSYISQT